VTDQAGSLLFAQYAYPPNALGLCGADVPRTLLEYGAARESDGGLAELARTFEGAWPYLALIAHANRIEDPLDPRVVEAYWIGNELLGDVRADALCAHLDERFGARLGRGRERLALSAGAGAVPHHCFHVFVVYPWVGLLRSGTVEEPLRVLDRCRIAPARVLAVGGDDATVELRPLVWDGSRLALGAPEERSVRWRDGGLGFARPAPGDRVALHWDFVCDVLSPRQERALAAATARSLAAANATGGIA